ncbi:MAG: YihA family ribosome biogenesis GTP-binding protein [Clostridia bacterium]|nr:YihA family ribosome biogenesis GTP-binding protein [Clostridia bacterium]
MQMSFGDINIHNTALALTAGSVSQHLKAGAPQIALSGRSNVGKSSLINSLLGRKKLARVSSEPGKTITVNYYSVDKKLYLVDLPGYGFAKRSKADILRWSALTENYFCENSALKCVFQLIDVKIGITDDDRMMLDYLKHYGIPFIIVATKCDKLNKTDLNNSVNRIIADRSLDPETQIVLYSATKDIGREVLWNKIVQAANGGSDDPQ